MNKLKLDTNFNITAAFSIIYQSASMLSIAYSRIIFKATGRNMSLAVLEPKFFKNCFQMIVRLSHKYGCNLPVNPSLHQYVPYLFDLMAVRHNYLDLPHSQYLRTISTNIPVLVTSLIIWWSHVNYHLQFGEGKEMREDLRYMVTVPTDAYKKRLHTRHGGMKNLQDVPKRPPKARGYDDMENTRMNHFVPFIQLVVPPEKIEEEITYDLIKENLINPKKVFGWNAHEVDKHRSQRDWQLIVMPLENFIELILFNEKGQEYFDYFLKQWNDVIAKNHCGLKILDDFFCPTDDKRIPPNPNTCLTILLPDVEEKLNFLEKMIGKIEWNEEAQKKWWPRRYGEGKYGQDVVTKSTGKKKRKTSQMNSEDKSSDEEGNNIAATYSPTVRTRPAG